MENVDIDIVIEKVFGLLLCGEQYQLLWLSILRYYLWGFYNSISNMGLNKEHVPGESKAKCSSLSNIRRSLDGIISLTRHKLL